MWCANCGSELPDGAAFCGECGAKVTPAAEYENSCVYFRTGHMAAEAEKKPLPDLYKALILLGICAAVGIVGFVIKKQWFSDVPDTGGAEEHTYAETDEIGRSDTEATAMTENESSVEQEMPPEIQWQVTQIDGRYNEIKEAVLSESYEKITFGDGITAYYDGEALKSVEITDDIDGALYDCSYYYEDDELIYAYYAGDDEHEFYFQGDRLIQKNHIVFTEAAESGDEQDTEKDAEYSEWESRVLSAGRSYMIDKKTALRLSANSGGTGEIAETDSSERDIASGTVDLEMDISEIRMENITEVSSSSFLSEYDMMHEPKRIMDGESKTAWVEGASGQGIGESVTLYFDDVYRVTGFKILAGYHKSKSLYRKNSRPKEIYIEFSDGSGETFVLEDQLKEQDICFSDSVDTEYIAITIKSVYPGSKFEDTAISEIELY